MCKKITSILLIFVVLCGLSTAALAVETTSVFSGTDISFFDEGSNINSSGFGWVDIPGNMMVLQPRKEPSNNAAFSSFTLPNGTFIQIHEYRLVGGIMWLRVSYVNSSTTGWVQSQYIL